MKLSAPFIASILCVAAFVSTAQAQLDLGSASDPIPYATFEGNDLANGSLADLEGKVVIVNYYTPW